MTAAANTYGTILRIGGPVFAETLIETEVQEAVRYMEEQASTPNVHSTGGPPPPTDGTGGYGEWSGAAQRARMIANLSNKLLADTNASMAVASAAVSTKAGGLIAPPMLVIPSAALQHQLLSPSTPIAQSNPLAKPPSARTEKEKILAPHARIAGVLILIQIATQNPHMFYQYTKLVLSRILCPLRDGCRFWVVKGSEEDWLTCVDGLEGLVTDGSRGSPAVGEEVLGARHLTTSSLIGNSVAPNTPNGSQGLTVEPKVNVEARDVVRRLAARLFRVTLRVIAERESAGHTNAQTQAQEGMDLDDAPPTPSVASPLNASRVALVRQGSRLAASSVSSSSMFSPPVQGGGGDSQVLMSAQGRVGRKGLRTSKPLVDVATAAANDLAAYLKASHVGKDGKGVDVKGKGVSDQPVA